MSMPNRNQSSSRENSRHHLKALRELFPNWNDDDLLSVLQEVNGEFEMAVTRISEGFANQWSQVKSKKEQPKTKPIDLNRKKERRAPHSKTPVILEERKKTVQNVSQVQNTEVFDESESRNFQRPKGKKSYHQSKNDDQKSQNYDNLPQPPKSHNNGQKKAPFNNQNQKSDSPSRKQVEFTGDVQAQIPPTLIKKEPNAAWSNLLKPSTVEKPFSQKAEIQSSPKRNTAPSPKRTLENHVAVALTLEHPSNTEIVTHEAVNSSETNEIMAGSLRRQSRNALGARKFRGEAALILPEISSVSSIGIRFGSLQLNESGVNPVQITPLRKPVDKIESTSRYTSPKYISSSVQASSNSPIISQTVPYLHPGQYPGSQTLDFGADQGRGYMGYFPEHIPHDGSSGAPGMRDPQKFPNSEALNNLPQGFSVNPYDYYPPYYMHGQFPYQSTYGHQFVNKGMYQQSQQQMYAQQKTGMPNPPYAAYMLGNQQFNPQGSASHSTEGGKIEYSYSNQPHFAQNPMGYVFQGAQQIPHRNTGVPDRAGPNPDNINHFYPNKNQTYESPYKYGQHNQASYFNPLHGSAQGNSTFSNYNPANSLGLSSATTVTPNASHPANSQQQPHGQHQNNSGSGYSRNQYWTQH